MRTNTLMRIQLLLTTLVNCSIKASARAVHSLPPAPDQRKDTAAARAPARGLRCAGADTDTDRNTDTDTRPSAVRSQDKSLQRQRQPRSSLTRRRAAAGWPPRTAPCLT